MSAPPIAIDFENDAFTEGIPHEMFRWLRDNDPVRWYDWPHGKGYWAVTRHDDLVAVHKDTATYSSETGATALEDLEPDAIEARKSMLDTDPPRHTRLRALVNRGFTPRAVAAYTDLLRELTDHILDRALPMGEFDFVDEVAAVLPIRVLCEILGVPHDDNRQLIEWGDAMIGSTDPDLSAISYEHPDSDRYRLLPFRSPVAREVYRYGHALAAKRREHPSDDIVTKLVQAEIDGERLTEQEFDAMFLLLVVAGNETTRQAIAHGMQAFMDFPERARAAAVRPVAHADRGRGGHPLGDAGAALPPHRHPRRRASRHADQGRATRSSPGTPRPTSTSGCSPIRCASTSAASPTSTSSFGRGGPHFCLGAHLAKLEVKIMFEELLPRIASVEPAGPPRRMRTNFTNALKAMPVRVVAA